MTALFLAAYLAVLLAGLALDGLNVAHLRRRGRIVPPELEGLVDGALLEKTAAYNTEHARLGIVSSVQFSLCITAPFRPFAAGYFASNTRAFTAKAHE